MRAMRSSSLVALVGAAVVLGFVGGCGDSSAGTGTTGDGSSGTAAGQGASSGSSSAGSSSAAGGTSGSGSTGASTGSASSASSTSSSGSTGLPAGWLYTQGNEIHVSDGSGGGQRWMGRGVNVDDIFLCGYDDGLWMSDGEQALTQMLNGLITDWKPNFIRLSLGMASYDPTVGWLSDASGYKTAMTQVVNALGANRGVYVMVTLRSDASMIDHDNIDGAEPTGLPSDASSTPDSTAFPSGTDATYVALVDTFADSSFVIFGLSNEPGGNTLSNATIRSAMAHAVGVIRAEEDRLGVPHHLVSVQGNGWTSDVSFYEQSPIAADGVVYEIHGYPPDASAYTSSTLPIVIGEYGSLDAQSAPAFFADVESKQIPNLAWDFESYSDCSPDLLQVNQSSTNLVPSAWGTLVKDYLTSHAP